MTPREIHWRLGAISRRKNLDYSFHASIHGIDLKTGDSEAVDPVELTEEQKTLIERQKAQSLARLKQRAGG